MGSKRASAWGASWMVAAMTLACGSGEAPAAPQPSAPPASVTPAPSALPSAAPPSTTPPSAGVAAPRAPLTPEERAAVARALSDARRLAHDQSWDDAATRFEVALALVPGDVDVRCETGYAQFRASHLDAAAAHMSAVLTTLPSDPPQRRRVRTAQCLYNIGLVAEARGDPAAARDAYTRSLALRPDATVSSHLDALPSADTAAPPAPTHQWIALPDGADDAAVAAALRAHYCAGWDVFGTPCPADLHATDVASAVSASPSASARIERADDGYTDYLVVRAGAATWFALLSDWYDSYGCANGFADYGHMALRDVIPGGPPELTFEFDGGCSRDVLQESWHVQQICRFDGGPRCVRLDTDFSGTYSAEWTGESEDSSVSHHADVSITGSEITITNGAGDLAFDELASISGTRPVATLLDSPNWPLPDPAP